MGNLADYFAKNCYQATWEIGDRVSGKYNGVPFVGTVGNDTLINETDGPRVSVHLDLPLKHKNEVKSVIFVSPKSLKSRE